MRIKYGFWGCVLLLLFMTAGLSACDSSSSGGGGATDTGYNQGMLTGTWRVNFEVLSPVPTVFVAELTFDAAGQLVDARVVFPVNTKGNVSNYRGSLTVYADGRVEGTLTNVVNIGAVTQAEKGVYRLKFKADGTLSGTRDRKIKAYMGGVLITDVRQIAKTWWKRK